MAPSMSPVRWGKTLGYSWAVRDNHIQQVSGWLTNGEKRGTCTWAIPESQKDNTSGVIKLFFALHLSAALIQLMWRPLRVAPFWGLDSDSVPSVTYPSVLGRNHFGFWSESFWVNCHHSSKWQHGLQSWSKKNWGGKPFISQTPCTWEGELALPSPELLGMAASVSSPSPLAEPFLFIFPFCLQCLPGLLLSPSVLRNVSPCCLFSSVSLHAFHTSRPVC